MRSDGTVALIGLVVVGIIIAIVSAIFDIGRWFLSEWHWLQIAGPVVLAFVLTVVFWDFLNALPDWVLKFWFGILMFGPLILGFLWMATEGGIWSFVAGLPVWLTASVVAGLGTPHVVGYWYELVDSAKESQRKREHLGLPQRKKPREAFGSAGKTSDEKLRDIGMI